MTYAIPRVDTNRTAHRLIHTFGSLSGVLEARYEDLRQVEGVGENAATLLTLFPSLTRRYLLSRTGEKPLLNTSERAGEYGRALFADCRVETLYLLCLDVKCRLLQAVKLAEGTIDRVPGEDILLEAQSRNTRENLRFAKRIMEANGYQTCVLVTSDYHMMRARMLAGQEGLSVTCSRARSDWPGIWFSRVRECLSWIKYGLGLSNG